MNKCLWKNEEEEYYRAVEELKKENIQEEIRSKNIKSSKESKSFILTTRKN